MVTGPRRARVECERERRDCCFLGAAFCFVGAAFRFDGRFSTRSASVRSSIRGVSVLVGSREMYEPATASGTKTSAAMITYFTAQS